MKIERRISTDVDKASARERLATYFALAGYVQATVQPKLITYHRGSFPALSPKEWKVNAVVQIVPGSGRPTQVDVTFDIDTTGQLVIQSERRFWQNEMDDLEQAVRTGSMDFSAREKENRSLARRSKILSLVILGLLGLLVAGMIFLFY